MAKKTKKTNKLWCVDRRQKVLLRDELATRGEGSVYRCNLQHYLAKIYREPEKQDFKKLRYMISNPPRDPTKSTRGHISIAWPADLLMGDGGKPVGFIMPFIRKGLPLVKIYNPRHRKKYAPGFNWKYLHVTAYNVALIVEALHEIGYVVGDIQSQNMLVNPQAMVSIIDTDSFQVTIESGKIYRCPVGASGFTPPELLGKNLRDHDRNKFHDCFGMAVLFHQLLLGYHPFSGKWTGESETHLGIDDFIRMGDWVGDQKGLLLRGKWCLPFEIVDAKLQMLFYRAFTEGHDDPRRRPTPKEWRETFKDIIDDLLLCEKNKGHYYSGTKPCCWSCEWQNSMVSGTPGLVHAIKSRAEVGAITLPEPTTPKASTKAPAKVPTPKASAKAPATPKAPSPPAKPLSERLAPIVAPIKGALQKLRSFLPSKWYTWLMTIVAIAGGSAFYLYYPQSLVFVKSLPAMFQEKVVIPLKPRLIALEKRLFPPPTPPADTVKDYFGKLNDGSFEQAWASLSKECKTKLSRKRMGLKQYGSYWNKRRPITVLQTKMRAKKEKVAIVDVNVELTKEKKPREYAIQLVFSDENKRWLVNKQKLR